MMAVTLFLALCLQNETPWRCGKCLSAAADADTELQGHKPHPAHGHAGPCQWRIHKNCGGCVASGLDGGKDWKILKVEPFARKDERLNLVEPMVFVGRAGDGEPRYSDEQRPPLTAKDELFLYFIWGWTAEGPDPRRLCKIAVELRDNTVRVIQGGEMNAQDGPRIFVGFRVPLGKLKAGEYAIERHVISAVMNNAFITATGPVKFSVER
jgi:hypothetical protein